MNKRTLLAACAASAISALALAPHIAGAQSNKPIKIALIASKTGRSRTGRSKNDRMSGIVK